MPEKKLSDITKTETETDYRALVKAALSGDDFAFKQFKAELNSYQKGSPSWHYLFSTWLALLCEWWMDKCVELEEQLGMTEHLPEVKRVAYMSVGVK